MQHFGAFWSQPYATRLQPDPIALPCGVLADKIRSMNILQITSVERPVDNPTILRALIPLINRAWAMGVPMPGRGGVFSLSVKTLNAILENARRLGIGRDIGTYLRAAPDVLERSPEEAAKLFAELSRALEESPVPKTEWASMRQVFSDDELETLLGTSRQSIARYAKEERETPADMADRLHWLAMVVADLAGAYNEFGIRAWFHRARSALGGRSPRQVLGKTWTSDGASAQQVRELAAALTDLGAT